MGDKRKLQADVDRCIKKIYEGKANFYELKSKMSSAQNSNQREKFESDMKKEIKRLQRLREQLKTWIGYNELKDKSALNAARRTIEELMENFKVIEKEAKTKAYSRDGLISAIKKDPTQLRREEFGTWVNDIFSTLRRQIEEYEAEIETMGKNKSKKASKDISQSRSSLERKISEHNEHIANLEKVLRLVENESLALSEAEDVKDDVEYYVDFHSQDNFIKNDDIYSKLGLDRVLVSNTPQLITEVANQPNKVEPVKCKRSLAEKLVSKPDIGRVLSFETPTPPPETKAREIVEKPQLSPPDTEKVETTAQSPEKKSVSSSTEPQTSCIESPSKKSAAKLSRPVPFISKQASLEKKAVERPPIDKEPSSSNITDCNIVKGESLKIVGDSGTIVPLNPPLKPPLGQTKVAPAVSSSVSESANEDVNSDLAVKSPFTEAVARRKDILEKIMSQEKIRERIIQNTNDAVTDHSNFIWNHSLKHTRHIDEDSILDEFDTFNENYKEMKSSHVLTKEHSQHNSISSFPITVPEYHNLPTKQLFMYPEFFNYLSLNVLFFIFYNFQGTCAQYNAAKAIKNRHWRYHTGLKTWFIRQCEPKLMTIDFEQGNYYYFDTEKWQKVYVKDFRFEFEFLEDKLLV